MWDWEKHPIFRPVHALITVGDRLHGDACDERPYTRIISLDLRKLQKPSTMPGMRKPIRVLHIYPRLSVRQNDAGRSPAIRSGDEMTTDNSIFGSPSSFFICVSCFLSTERRLLFSQSESLYRNQNLANTNPLVKTIPNSRLPYRLKSHLLNRGFAFIVPQPVKSPRKGGIDSVLYLATHRWTEAPAAESVEGLIFVSCNFTVQSPLI